MIIDAHVVAQNQFFVEWERFAKKLGVMIYVMQVTTAQAQMKMKRFHVKVRF